MITFVDKFLDKIQKNFEDSKEIEKDDFVIVISSKNNVNMILIEKINEPKSSYYESMKIQKYKYKIGICKEEFFDKFEKDYRRDFMRRHKKIKDFVSSHNNEVYLHTSPDPIVELNERNINSYYLDAIRTFNPNGFWYSCGTAWLDWWFGPISEHLDLTFRNIRERERFVDLTPDWYPWNVYVLNFDKVKIGEIENCKDLFSFSRKYKCRDPKGDRYLSLRKIKKDYDGIQICPYLGIKCNSFFKKMLSEGKFGSNTRDLQIVSPQDWVHILSLALNGKISKKDQSILWSYKWEASTGVVLKNIKKIGLTKLI